MTPTKASLILIFSSLACLSIASDQGRSPHGLANEYPMALSPSAYEFFHPMAQKPNPTIPPIPLAAQVETADQPQFRSQEAEMLTYHKGGAGLGPGATVGVVLGLACAVSLAMGTYYAVVARHKKSADQVKTFRPEV